MSLEDVDKVYHKEQVEARQLEKDRNLIKNIDHAELRFAAPPKKISCGINHTLSISNALPYNKDGQLLGEDEPPIVYAWGRNVHNVMGAGEDVTSSPTPLKINCPDFERGLGVYEVACGISHSLFLVKTRLSEGGQVYGSGLGNRGRQGYLNPEAEEDAAPEVEDIWYDPGVPKHIPIGDNEYIVRVVCGADHSMALALSGVLWAWGLNSDGQCGVGTSADVLSPTPVKMPAAARGGQVLVGHLALGAKHSIMVGAGQAAGKVYVWGCNELGRLGLGSSREEKPFETHPVLLESLMVTKASTASAGEAHSGVLDVHGNLWMWGQGSYGRLGTGELTDLPTPRYISMPEESRVLQVALGSFHSVVLCGTARRQQLFSWGYGDALGNRPGGGISPTPQVVNTAEHMDNKDLITQIDAGPYHTLLLTDAGDLITFGQGSSGRLGTGRSGSSSTPVKVYGPSNTLVGFALKWKHLQHATTGAEKVPQAAGDEGPTSPHGHVHRRVMEHAAERGLRAAGTSSGGEMKGRESWEISRVCCGGMFSGAVTYGGALYLWGSGSRGQMGFGNISDLWAPKAVRITSGTMVKNLALGREHVIAVTNEGAAYAWGKGDRGQLGVGRNEDTLVPKVVEGLSEVLRIAAAEDHSGAICHGDEGNQLFMWGSTEMGKLGLGTGVMSQADVNPTVVRAFAKSGEPYREPVALSLGQYHTAVVCTKAADEMDPEDKDPFSREVGRVWTFGGGWFGRLGHNDMENRFEPKLVRDLMQPVTSVHCGTYHTCAITYESGVFNEAHQRCGDLWVWGKNRSICEHEHGKVPIKFMQIDGHPKFSHVATSDSTTIVVTQMGVVYGWGDNRSGQLGIEGGKKEIPLPEIIRNLPQPPHLIDMGPAHVIVYTRNQVMLAWGNQSCGRLGLKDRRVEKIQYRPRGVRAEWTSIEAMSGAMMDEDEDGGKVTAASLASIGEDEEEEAESDKDAPESAYGDEGGLSAKDKMMQAITSGQQIHRFATMQMMLKEESEASRMGTLRRTEKELSKMIFSSLQDIMACPEMERRVATLAERCRTNFDTVNQCLGLRQPDDTREGIDAVIHEKLEQYEELCLILQMQVGYLASLSMTVHSEGEEVFIQTASALFHNLADHRTNCLMIMLMQRMAVKEIEQAKSADDIFQPSSKVAQLFKAYALHPFHLDEIAHSLMDSKERPNSLLGMVANKTVEEGQTFALNFDQYLKSPGIESKLKEEGSSKQEMRKDYQRELDLFLEFMKTDAVLALSKVVLPHSFWSFFCFCRDEIKEGVLVASDGDESGAEVDLKLMEPIFRLFMNCIVLPMLQNMGKYGGREVGLFEVENNNDPHVLWNLSVVIECLVVMMTGNYPKDNSGVEKLAARIRPDLQRYLLDSVTGISHDTETQLTIHTLLVHYETVPERIYMNAWLMMSISNLLISHMNKVRFGMGDPLDEICKKIGTWDGDILAKAQKEEVLYNLKLYPRFLLKEKSMVICPTSRCTVPNKMSSEVKDFGGGELTLEQGVNILSSIRDDNQFAVVEELFRDLPNLKATTFLELKAEFEAIYDQCSSGTHKNLMLSDKLKKGLGLVNDFIETDSNVEEMLETMGAVLVYRSHHSKYLHTMMHGITRLQKARDDHAKQMQRSEIELKALYHYSKSMQSPSRVRRAAEKTGGILRGDALKSQIAKLEEKMAFETSQNQKFVRFPLSELLDDKKVSQVFNELERVNPEEIFLTFNATTDGVKIHVGLNKSKQKNNLLEFVKVIFLPDEEIKKFHLAEKADTLNLPLDGPVLIQWRTVALAETLKQIT